MKLVKWWFGRHFFGFALYWNPNRNPILGLSKANGWVLFIGRKTRHFRR